MCFVYAAGGLMLGVAVSAVVFGYQYVRHNNKFTKFADEVQTDIQDLKDKVTGKTS